MAFTEIDPSQIPAEFRQGSAAVTELDENDIPEEFRFKPQTSKLDAFGVGLSQGLTAGYSDELIGALTTMFKDGIMPNDPKWDDAYKANRDAVRQFDDTAKSEHPILTTGSDIASSIATMPKTAGVGLLKGAAKLAGYGGVRGAGEAEEMADVPAGIATGALAGAATGAIAPALSGAARKAGSALETAGTKAGEVVDKGFDYANRNIGKLGKFGVNDLVKGVADDVVDGIAGASRKVGLDSAGQKLADWYASNPTLVQEMMGRSAAAWATGGTSLATELSARVGAGSLKVSGKGMNYLGKLVDDPTDLLDRVRGTKFYRPLMEAASTSPSLFRGSVFKFLNDPDFRSRIGYDTEAED